MTCPQARAIAPRLSPPAPRPFIRQGARRARGQAAIEYLVLLLLVGISLGLGAGGPLGALWQSLLTHHARLTDAVSRP
ncbi:MAG: hypothetical protein KGQ67_00615 [Betaproteobacteria bacterium]|nr:hypothetical protein [Betaproteobacteria bacterium]